MQVFVPQNWQGINGIPPLELDWKENLPVSMKPRARPVNPKLFDNAKKEFERLSKYFYTPSNSDIASCLVIAPKATAPFLRFCGDYVSVNKYITIGHYPIPHVQRQLEKICKFNIFLDFDWVNSFHQIKLGPITSSRLSVQTPWGQVEPKFMPEGIGPASGVLQSVVAEAFKDFEEWSIAIFDNLLVLAKDYEDAYTKTELILNRCIERNIFLKFSKTWLGFDNANFFGYVCRHNTYELSESRKDSIDKIPFPNSLKEMQSFLGSAIFFKSFVANFSHLAAPLNDMVKKDFDWSNKDLWSTDYERVFNDLKNELRNSMKLYYPDYSLEWILRVDASQLGVGAVLLMAKPNDNDSTVLLPISFASQKFSPQATRWTTIEQEAYACYFGVKYFSYYLHCKHFILETDHNNLIWIEASAVPKVIRWRIYLQSFHFHLRHIPGKLNKVADHLSRHHVPDNTSSHLSHNVLMLSLLNHSADLTISSAPAQKYTHSEAMRQVHGGRMGHPGARVTWLNLNKYFPGHHIPYKVVSDFVANCPICQKDRLGMHDALLPIVRHLKPEHKRSMVGVDTLTITPSDQFGNTYLTVIVNHFTKHSAGYPSSNKGAEATATALFQYFCTFGIYESIISDPGSEFMAEAVQHLHKWLGIRHVVSLVDRHESNGVEGTNKQILRHLKALIFDERVKNQWSSNVILPIVFFIINSTDSTETGVVPFHAHFGSVDATCHRLPTDSSVPLNTNSYVKLLDANLKMLFQISKNFQNNLITQRLDNSDPLQQNQFQPGDFVLFQHNPNDPLPTKLSPRYLGPFQVVKQYKNDVECQSLIHGDIQTFHVTRLKLFHGSSDEAKQLAQLDNDQYTIDAFITYRGDPLVRTTIEFHVKFADNSLVWLPWSNDLFQTIQYEDFCRSRPELYPLLYSVKHATVLIKEVNQSRIESISPGDTAYVDLRCYGATWFASLELPDLFHTTYVVSYYYLHFCNLKQTKINVRCELFDEEFKVDHHFIRSYGSKKTLDPTFMVLIDKSFVLKFPAVLPDNKRDVLLKRYSLP
jgi:hypothetical protein